MPFPKKIPNMFFFSLCYCSLNKNPRATDGREQQNVFLMVARTVDYNEM